MSKTNASQSKERKLIKEKEKKNNYEAIFSTFHESVKKLNYSLSSSPSFDISPQSIPPAPTP
jgi:hypothetical protein